MVILSNETLEGPVQLPGDSWAQKDTRRLLRACYHVSNLDAAIQFYNRYFGLLLSVKLDFPGAPLQRALMAGAAGDGQEHFQLELRCREPSPDVAFGVAADGTPASAASQPLRLGDGLDHFTVVVPDAPDAVAGLRRDGLGHLVAEELAAVFSVRSEGASKQDKVSLVRDLDGWPWQLLELHAAHAPERLCTVSIRVRDVAASLRWYQQVLGMRVLQKYEATGGGHISALVGFTPELDGPLLELRQAAHDRPMTDLGNAFAWFVLGTADLAGTMVNLEVQGEAWEKVELPSCEDPTQTVGAATVADPDGWRFCLVQHSPAVPAAQPMEGVEAM
ncbi:hypothetical protein N2152v2_002010 [Parachlorella kessleri]